MTVDDIDIVDMQSIPRPLDGRKVDDEPTACVDDLFALPMENAKLEPLHWKAKECEAARTEGACRFMRRFAASR
ncbi:hypothetical protein BWQ96_08224 [Gracilariopsis chorda]|uniref:Uncharacterized protein n=1 Tax=Gracilariopsis chorda TaxID=448386 RepID=A0A2V3IIY7_9FLOR|nr:hypothetical protein BWQ96_08224 [Gracilariopsis chorda]|eukprot:PXF42056.1 hypothetical protein BWQ96_08224 [Gracilariopsis chorda]